MVIKLLISLLILMITFNTVQASDRHRIALVIGGDIHLVVPGRLFDGVYQHWAGKILGGCVEGDRKGRVEVVDDDHVPDQLGDHADRDLFDKAGGFRQWDEMDGEMSSVSDFSSGSAPQLHSGYRSPLRPGADRSRQTRRLPLLLPDQPG